MSIIQINNLSKNFGKLKAVNNISLDVKENEILGLLGPNGAGKSTLISMLLTLLKPDEGTVIIDNLDLASNSRQIKKMLGFVPQEIALYPTLTAVENLSFWGRMYGIKQPLIKKRVAETLEIVGLADRAKDRIEKYSGGMKRRINIAVALLNQPKILILDEPTVGIDPQSRNYILETILKLNKEGMTVLYTSHYMEEVEYICSRIAIMDHGSIIAQGVKEELKKLIDKPNMIVIAVTNATEDIEKRITAMEGVKKLSIKDDELSITCDDAKLILDKIVSLLNASHCGIRSIVVDQINLESVFLFLTGRSLRD